MGGDGLGVVCGCCRGVVCGVGCGCGCGHGATDKAGGLGPADRTYVNCKLTLLRAGCAADEAADVIKAVARKPAREEAAHRRFALPKAHSDG